jgi:hypothetical protein
MLTATGRFLFFVYFLAETLLRLAAAFFGVRFWPVLFFHAMYCYGIQMLKVDALFGLYALLIGVLDLFHFCHKVCCGQD